MNNKNDIHGGNFSAVSTALNIPQLPELIYDFSVNINPFGMPLAVERAIAGMSSADYSNYPEPYANSANKALAKAHGISPASTLTGNGSTELFSWIVQTIKPKVAHCIAPCYTGYSEVCNTAGIPLIPAIFAKPENNFAIELNKINFTDIKLIFIASPNNPTGVTIPKQKILSTAIKNPDTFFIVDESFIDFLPEEKSLFYEKQLPENIAIVKSLTKFFAIAGIRLGIIHAAPRTIAKFAKKHLPWSVNSIAQKIAHTLYSDKNYICETRKNICELRKNLSAKLVKFDELKIYPGYANFILCQITSDTIVQTLQKKLIQKAIMIRNCTEITGLNNSFFRIAVKNKNDNDLLINTLNNILTTSPVKKIHTCKKNPIMIVGTTSDAGKSIVTTALCRYYSKKGIKVAPFKAQNMSLNSFVTKEGGEMGRAQVVQAEAAGIQPHTDMNPVLLKPTGNAGSQLILNGKPLCNVTARSYYEEKCELRKDAQAAYDRLASRFQMIIIEGAGSPAEINLQKQDFVNMAMAQYANATTILVADINPGGVFASIYGTVKLIPQNYRKFLSGIIINKFRGDVSLLKEGIVSSARKSVKLLILGSRITAISIKLLCFLGVCFFESGLIESSSSMLRFSI